MDAETDTSSTTPADRTVYTIGDQTMARVFKPAGLENVADLQAVFDAMEAALAAEFGNEEQPRYTTKRLREEILKAEERGRLQEREAAAAAPDLMEEAKGVLDDAASIIRVFVKPEKCAHDNGRIIPAKEVEASIRALLAKIGGKR